MQIDVLRPRELSADTLAAWRDAQAADPAFDTGFLSPQWARAVEEAQGEASRVRVAVLSEGGEPRGFLPARTAAFTAMPAGAPMCDYQAVVGDPGLKFEPKRLVQALGVSRLDFSHFLGQQTAFQPYMRGQVASHVVDISQGFAGYEAEKRSVLKDLDKKRRKAERDIGEAVFTAFSRSQADFDQLIAWKRAQFAATGQTDIFAARWTLRLLQGLFESRDPDFGAVLYTLHLGGRPAAAQLNLRGRHTIHAWIIGHNPEFERYSPGLLLFQDILRWMAETPYSRLDLGPGEVRFKKELANAAQIVAHGFVGVPSPATLFREAAYGVRRVAESLPLGRVSALPGKAMRRVDQWRGLR